MRAFVEALAGAGLECRIESIDPGCAMVRRLRRAHDGWGKDRCFSLYFVTHAPSPRSSAAVTACRNVTSREADARERARRATTARGRDGRL